MLLEVITYSKQLCIIIDDVDHVIIFVSIAHIYMCIFFHINYACLPPGIIQILKIYKSGITIKLCIMKAF